VSDAPSLRRFVVEALTDLGASPSDGESLVWVQAPETVQRDLEVPANFALAFDPERSREFDAELVAPGSYFLERLVSVVARRGRWDVARFTISGTEWVSDALLESGLGPQAAVRPHVHGIEDELLLLFAFRVTLLSDEKRESFYLVAISPGGSAWSVDPHRLETGLVPDVSCGSPPDLETSYRLATEFLCTLTDGEVERFRTRSLGLLEEEVRRIFGYFDRTIEALRESDPGGSQELLRAVMAERDQRLTEAVERFDPKARASLCSIRAILVPTARLRLEFPDGTGMDAGVDAWSRRLRGLVCRLCGGTAGPWHASSRDGLRCVTCASTPVESARPRGRPRSGTPRRGTRAAEVSARSPRGSKARSRGASAGRRRP